MNKEIQYIISSLQRTLDGEPWYGRPVLTLLKEIDPALAFKKTGNNAHSMADLLWHMNAWAEFVLKRLEGDQKADDQYMDQIDWRPLDPAVHSWEEGLRRFQQLNQQIIAILQGKDADFLKEIVDFRQYNFRFLLNGYIQHNIYHIGQVAYCKKLLEGS